MHSIITIKQSCNCSREAFQIETFKWYYRNRVHKWFLAPSSCYSLSFWGEFIPFHCDRQYDLQLHCSSNVKADELPWNGQWEADSAQTGAGRTEQRITGSGENKLYNSCCWGTLAGTNREATNYHYRPVFLLQLQGELHTRGGRGFAINHITVIVPLMLGNASGDSLNSQIKLQGEQQNSPHWTFTILSYCANSAVN